MKHPIVTGYVEETTSFKCPTCKQENRIDGDAINRVAKCEFCGLVAYIAEPKCQIFTSKQKENERET